MCECTGCDQLGTKTEFVLVAETGEILRRLKLPQSNPNDIGFDKCCALISEGIDVLLEYAPDVCGIYHREMKDAVIHVPEDGSRGKLLKKL